MIESILWAAVMLAGLCGGLALPSYALATESLRLGVLSFVYWSICFGLVIYALGSENSRGPCVRYETQLYPMGETMMPARVERGEWVEDLE